MKSGLDHQTGRRILRGRWCRLMHVSPRLTAIPLSFIQSLQLNVNVETTVTQEDEHIKEAIQASLKDLPSEESDVFPFEDTVREGGR